MNKKVLLAGFLSGLIVLITGCSNWEDSKYDVGEFVGELKGNGAHPVAVRQPTGTQQVERVQGATVSAPTAVPAPKVAMATPRYVPARPAAPAPAAPRAAKVEKPSTQEAVAPETRKVPMAAARPSTAKSLRRDVLKVGELED